MFPMPGQTLYDPCFEHDACGTGFVARVSGQPGREILEYGLQALANLAHRGAMDADGKSGDGAGVLTQLPRRLLLLEAERLGVRPPRAADLGLGMLMLPRERADAAVALVNQVLCEEGVPVLVWRRVPVDPDALGDKARATLPDLRQVFVVRPAGLDDEAFERRLYLARKVIERRAAEAGLDDLYVPSFSCRTVVYKGLMAASQLPRFYRDLADPRFETALCLFHQRYSTNTFPTWPLAQPFRLLAHNGEINTLQGNRNWMRAREADLRSAVWGDDLERLKPIIWEAGSDSASLDNTLELLLRSGRDLAHGLMMLMPRKWGADADPDLEAFERYHACLTEPWDGPAALTFSDGVQVGATLDRNGLRPCRYKITEDGLVLAASETGVVEIGDRLVLEKGRLGPGQLLLVDTARQVVLHDAEVKAEVTTARPYREWAATIIDLHPNCQEPSLGSGLGEVLSAGIESRDPRLLTAFGVTNEDLKLVVRTMAVEGKEAVWSMGDDTPLAVLSRLNRSFYTYFKQRFAQVTNPPIDPLREQTVMSLEMLLGPSTGYLEDGPEYARMVRIPTPVLLEPDLAALRRLSGPLACATLDATFDAGQGPAGLEPGLDQLCRDAERAVDAGYGILVVSDRAVSPERAPIPMLLAVGAVHHHLIRVGKRSRASLVAEAGDAWDVHHLALLIGYGASAVHPYVALALVRQLAEQPEPRARAEAAAELDVEQAVQNYVHAAELGLQKIMSKMGISALASYHGGQIFEALGISQTVIDRCFAGTPSRLGGVSFVQIAEDVLSRHALAFAEADRAAASDGRLPDTGLVRYRRDGEAHAWGPPIVRTLHKALEGDGDPAAYRQFVDMLLSGPPLALRDLLTFAPREPIPLEEVEPAERIVRRFISTAMSLGALSPEAHRTLAIAMNRMGARSNSGEGGEDPETYRPLPNGDRADNKIKQVASGRFGVTAEYLAHADELEIKMAQGSKPGEGGQIPASKVSELIARLRHAQPGISLISPPPHHDIYSIEDLAQLIYDLKCANPRALVGVKLVSEAGVGTVAAGVAKAYADYVLVSGHDGGTGASPLSSIKHAGIPWELGLAEAQQVLVLNGLRGRVRLRTDGGLRTGRDVVIAACLGAEEFGFGTAAVVALGCDMARQCHLNTCPTGIATQREDLRKKFEGTPEKVIHYFTHLAEDVRGHLARLGFRTLEEIVGRVDLLRAIPPEQRDPRAATLDLSLILADPDPTRTLPRRNVEPRNNRPSDESLDDAILQDAAEAIAGGPPFRASYRIRNRHRSVGARVAGEIARLYGSRGLPERSIDVRLRGAAGQSFGAFCVRGLRLTLVGEANDYVGKGMSGGELILTPTDTARFPTHRNVILGNTALYGATGGRLFAAGRAGERFAVRNSGAIAVVEGVGAHGCEYMTGGLVVVLGETGQNFAAGMSGGVAYVLDELGSFPSRVNGELVRLERAMAREDLEQLYGLIREHFERTGSPRAADILDVWDYYRELFWKVAPRSGPPPVVPPLNRSAAPDASPQQVAPAGRR